MRRLFPYGRWQAAGEATVFFSTIIFGLGIGLTVPWGEVKTWWPIIILISFWVVLWFWGIFLPIAKQAMRNYEE
jgi:hypothetical protein